MLLRLCAAVGLSVPAGAPPRAAPRCVGAGPTAEESLLRLLTAETPPDEAEIDALCAELEASAPPDAAPALDPRIEGDWLLLHTSKSEFDPRSPLGARADGSTPGLEALFARVTGGSGGKPSASPLQRALTRAFPVKQTITLRREPRALSFRCDTPIGELILSAAATTSPNEPRRIGLLFDEGYLAARNGVRVPYPVPFRALGDEARGWLDTSFLGETLRISTGNKGTRFVLQRQEQ